MIAIIAVLAVRDAGDQLAPVERWWSMIAIIAVLAVRDAGDQLAPVERWCSMIAIISRTVSARSSLTTT
jgi:hypothetical protein